MLDILNCRNTTHHALPSNRVCRMNGDAGRHKTTGDNGFLNPANHIIPRAAAVVPEVVIETDVRNATLFKESDYLLGPVRACPTTRCLPHIIKPYFHGYHNPISK